MTDLELARRLSAGRTKGPWTYESAGDKPTLLRDLRAEHPKHWKESEQAYSRGGWIPFSVTIADAAFIAYFGTHADSLLDELEALRSVAEAAKNRVSENCYCGPDDGMCAPCREQEELLDKALAAWRSLKTEGEGA